MPLPPNSGGMEFDPKQAAELARNLRDAAIAQSKLTNEQRAYAKATEALGEKQKKSFDDLKNGSIAAAKEAGASADVMKALIKYQEELTTGERESLRIKRAILAIENLGLSGVTSEIAGRAAANAAAKNQLSSISGMVQEQQRLASIVSAEDTPAAARLAAAEQELKLRERMAYEIRQSSTEMGAFQKEASKKAAPTGMTRALESPGILGAALRSSGMGLSVAREEKEQAISGKPMSMGAAASSAAMEGLAHVIGTISPALSTASSAMDLFGSVVRTVLAALDEGRMVTNRSMQALAMSSNDAFESVNFGLDGNADAIREASGVTVGQATLMGSAYTDLRDSAQDAMLSFNALGRDSSLGVNNWTGNLIKAGVEGQEFGIETSKSIHLVIDAARAFGTNAEQSRTAFENMALGARVAGLQIGDFNSALGESVEWGKKFGDQSGIYQSMAYALHGVQRAGLGAVDLMQMGGAISGLARDPTMMLGLRSQQIGSAKAISEIFSASNTGAKAGQTEFDEALRTAAGFLSGQKVTSRSGQSMTAMQALNSKNAEDKFQGAQLAAQVLFKDPSMWAKFGNENFLKGFEKMLSNANLTDKQKEAINKEMKGTDMQNKGFNAMVGSRDALKIISETLTSMAKVIVHMGTSAVFAHSGFGGESAGLHEAERKLMSNRLGSGRAHDIHAPMRK